MEQTRWSSELAYGFAETEQLHPAFFEQLNKLEAMEDDQFVIHFEMFVSDLEKDLRAEELWMEEINFSAIKVHRALHAEALGLLHKAHSRNLAGDFELARRMTALLPEWFVEHVVTMDLPLANALRLAALQSKKKEPALTAA